MPLKWTKSMPLSRARSVNHAPVAGPAPAVCETDAAGGDDGVVLEQAEDAATADTNRKKNRRMK
ncbi:MAG: hypothetical protein QM736_25225 [Vicinamibacterales bacterium]